MSTQTDFPPVMQTRLALALEQLADDLGRFRRFVQAEDQYTTVLLDRIAHHVERIQWLLEPRAGERYEALVAFGMEGTEAVRTALAEVDELARRQRIRLGLSGDT